MIAQFMQLGEEGARRINWSQLGNVAPFWEELPFGHSWDAVTPAMSAGGPFAPERAATSDKSFMDRPRACYD